MLKTIEERVSDLIISYLDEKLDNIYTEKVIDKVASKVAYLVAKQMSDDAIINANAIKTAVAGALLDSETTYEEPVKEGILEQEHIWEDPYWKFIEDTPELSRRTSHALFSAGIQTKEQLLLLPLEATRSIRRIGEKGKMQIADFQRNNS